MSRANAVVIRRIENPLLTETQIEATLFGESSQASISTPGKKNPIEED
jgi:hypothetical protein